MIKVSSSYIFFPRQENNDGKDKVDKRTIRIQLHSIDPFLHKAFPGLQSPKKEKKLFEVRYELEANDEGNGGKVLFVLNRVGETTYLKIQVENRTNKTAIELLDEVQKKLYLTDIRKDYLDIVSFDGVSEYYCNKLYPVLGKLERLLRSLLLKVYTLNYKQEYYEKFDAGIRSKAKGNIRVGKNTPLSKGEMRKEYEAHGKQLSQLAYTQHFFESLDFNTLELLLFTERTREEDLEKLDAFLRENDDLSEVSDSVLREKYDAMRPQSDWDRLFREKVGIKDMKESLDEIREFRNRVAHCRPVCKADYDRAKTLCKTINKALEKAIELTEEKDFVRKNFEELRDVSGNIAATMKQLSKHMQGIVANVAETMGRISIPNAVLDSMAKQREYASNVMFASTGSAISELQNVIASSSMTALKQQHAPLASMVSVGDVLSSSMGVFADFAANNQSILAESAKCLKAVSLSTPTGIGSASNSVFDKDSLSEEAIDEDDNSSNDFPGPF